MGKWGERREPKDKKKDEGSLWGNLQAIGPLVQGTLRGLVEVPLSAFAELGGLPNTVARAGLEALGVEPEKAESMMEQWRLMNPGTTVIEGFDLAAEHFGHNTYNPFEERPGAIQAARASDGNVLQQFSETATAAAPTWREIVWNSPGRSIGRIGQTGKAIWNRDPEQLPYVQAYKENRLIPTVLEDVANAALAASIVSGGTSAAAGRATSGASKMGLRGGVVADDLVATGRIAPEAAASAVAELRATPPTLTERLLAPHAVELQDLSARMGTASQAANRVAELPLRPVLAPFRAGVKAYRGEPTGLIGQTMRPVVEPFVKHAEMLALRQQIQHAPAARSMAERNRFNTVWQEVEAQLPDDASRAAFWMVDQLDDDALKFYRDNPDQFARHFPDLPEGTLDRLAEIRIDRGPLRDIVEEGWERLKVEGGKNVMAEARATGYGSSRFVSPEEQMQRLQEQGDVAMEWAVQRQLESDPAYEAAVASGDTATIEALETAARNNIENAPPAYRNVLRNNYRLTNELLTQAKDYGSRSAALYKAAREVDDPVAAANFLTTARADRVKAAALRAHAQIISKTMDDIANGAMEMIGGHVIGGKLETPVSGSLRSLRSQKLIGERNRKGTSIDATFEGQFRRMMEERIRMHQNAVAQEVIREYGVKVDPDSGWQEFVQQRGDENVRFVNEFGETIPPTELLNRTEPTYVVPKEIERAIQETKTKLETNPLLRLYDKGLGWWKIATLALNPRWVYQNIIGNSLMAATELTPRQMLNVVGELVSSSSQIRNLRKTPDDATAFLLQRGFTAEELKSIGSNVERSPVGLMFKMNEVVDDTTRIAIYWAKREDAKRLRSWADEQIKAGRISKEQWDRLEASAKMTEEQALDRALKVAGDFSTFTPFEKNIVRRVIPFYGWLRHQTKLMFRLPVEHPARVAWTLHLTDMFVDNKDLPDWLQGALKIPDDWPIIGGTFLSTNWSPFATPEHMPVLSVRSAAASLSPFIQIPAAAFGLNVGRGRQLMMPPGTYPTGPEGREEMFRFIGWGNPAGPGRVPNSAALTGPLGKFLAGKEVPVPEGGLLGYLMGGSIPQVRMLRDTLQTGPEEGVGYARYDTGEPLVRKGSAVPISTKPLPSPAGPVPQAVTGFLTGLTFQSPDLEQLAAIEADRRKKREKRRKSYEKARRRAFRKQDED
ncbi:MAG: hypothetical protein N2037_10170 [Acidimicrobiales bacterium]|nr:hypothetical protein [Acidimicrobiales bacterium]